MSKSVIMGGGSASAGFGTNYFCGVGGQISFNSTEAYRQAVFRESGTVSRFFINITANTYTGTAATATFRKNSAATALTVSITAGVTGIFEDTTNTVTVADGDTYGFELDASPPASGSATVSVVAVQFEPDTAGDTVTYHNNTVSAAFSTNSTTRYYSTSQQTVQTTEANAQIKASDSYTASRFSVYVSANTRTTDVVYRTRKNSANGSQSVTYTSGQTGRKTDTSNTDSIASGDTFNYSITTLTGSNSITTQTISCRFVNTTAAKWQFNSNAVATISSNSTTYRFIAGASGTNGTESAVEYRAPFDFTLKNFRVYTRTNPYATLSTTFTLRKNTADTAIAITFTAGQTGWKEDVTNTVAVTATDTLAFKIVTPNEAGNFQVDGMTIEGYTGAVAAVYQYLTMMGVGS